MNDSPKLEQRVKILAGLPTYDGTRCNGAAMGSLYRFGADTLETQSSLLASSFNRCWAEALNRREGESPITHFLLLHADVMPLEPDWIQQLVEEAQACSCKVLSVAVPIKTAVGSTSTALETEDLWHPRRLTVRELLQKPVTWTAPTLLVNTGLLLVDFREAWVERICFTINDRIYKPNGRWIREVEPEDWNFSRQCHALGVDVWVTRRVAVQHVGRNVWRNDHPWGEETDPLFA